MLGGGKLGDGTNIERYMPVYVSSASNADWIKIVAGSYQSCGIASDLSLSCWGNMTDPSGIDKEGDILDICTGQGHVCTITRSGDGICWGATEFGQIGTGETYALKVVNYSPGMKLYGSNKWKVENSKQKKTTDHSKSKEEGVVRNVRQTGSQKSRSTWLQTSILTRASHLVKPFISSLPPTWLMFTSLALAFMIPYIFGRVINLKSNQ